MNNTFCKAERINSKLIIDKLFAGGNSSMAVFPLRVVFMKTERATDQNAAQKQLTPPVSILITVPKKRFHHAVDRNRFKRQVREAYRTQKSILWDVLAEKDYTVAIAFVCITEKPVASKNIHKAVGKALIRIAEKLQAEDATPQNAEQS